MTVHEGLEESTEPISHDRVAKNTLIYMAGQLLSWVMTFLSVSIIPRRLGESNIGHLAIAATAVGAVANMLMLGLDGFISAEIGRNKGQSERIVQAFLGLRLSLLPLLVIGAMIALHAAHASPLEWTLGWIAMASVGVGFVFAPLRAVLMGWEEARPVSVYTLWMGIAPLLAIPFLYLGPAAYALISLFGGLPGTFATILATRRRIHLRPRIDTKMWEILVRGSSAFLLTEFVAQFYDIGSVFILKHYTGAAGVGVYSQAMELLGTFLFVPTAIGYALLPSLTRLAQSEPDTFARLQQRVFVLLVVLSLPIAILALMLAHPFCHFLYGSQKFRSLPITVQFCALNVLPLYTTTILYRFLIAQRRNHIWAAFMLGTVGLNALLCWFLIPLTLRAPGLHTGAAGAIIASAIAETVTTVCAFVLLRTNPLNRDNLGRIARALLAGLAMAGVMWATRGLFFALTALLGLAAFGAVAWKLEALGVEEQRKIAELLQNKLPARFRKAGA